MTKVVSARVRFFAVAGMLAIACGRGADKPSMGTAVAQVVSSPDVATRSNAAELLDTTTVPIGNSLCVDTLNEVRAIACSRGAVVRRDSITLDVRWRNGNRRFVNTGGEAPGGYRYIGTIGDSSLHIVQEYGNETYPRWLVIEAAAGRSAIVSEWPAFSPSGRRFATGGSAWDNCSESDGTTLEVWRFTARGPVREWSEVTQDCRQGQTGGWGAVGLSWRGEDTVEFTRQWFEAKGDDVVRRSRPGRAVRAGGRWRIQPDSQPARPM